ncbi:MAG: hypothetical protein AAF607_16005, partial [Pseudomonadota bacterium]
GVGKMASGRWLKAVYLGFVALNLAACATSYKSVALEEPHATITFQRNMSGTRAVNNEPYQGYELVDGPSCANDQKVAWFSFDGEYIETARFAANKKLHFVMHSVQNQNLNGPWCFSYLGFDALNGRDYLVMHERCSALVFDVTDGNRRRLRSVDVIDGFECPKQGAAVTPK